MYTWYAFEPNIETKELHFRAHQVSPSIFLNVLIQAVVLHDHHTKAILLLKKKIQFFVHIVDIHWNRLKSKNHGTVIRACSQLEMLFVLYVRYSDSTPSRRLFSSYFPVVIRCVWRMYIHSAYRLIDTPFTSWNATFVYIIRWLLWQTAKTKRWEQNDMNGQCEENIYKTKQIDKTKKKLNKWNALNKSAEQKMSKRDVY